MRRIAHNELRHHTEGRDHSTGAVVIAALWLVMFSAIVIAGVSSQALQSAPEIAARY